MEWTKSNVFSTLHILASSPLAGVHSISANHKRQIFVLGHAEYDKFTLKEEYDRDVSKNLLIEVPGWHDRKP